jgi:hypothetical protein
MRVEAEGPCTGDNAGRRCSPVKREAGKRVEHVWNMRDVFSSAVKRNTA